MANNTIITKEAIDNFIRMIDNPDDHRESDALAAHQPHAEVTTLDDEGLLTRADLEDHIAAGEIDESMANDRHRDPDPEDIHLTAIGGDDEILSAEDYAAHTENVWAEEDAALVRDARQGHETDEQADDAVLEALVRDVQAKGWQDEADREHAIARGAHEDEIGENETLVIARNALDREAATQTERLTQKLDAMSDDGIRDYIRSNHRAEIDRQADAGVDMDDPAGVGRRFRLDVASTAARERGIDTSKLWAEARDEVHKQEITSGRDEVAAAHNPAEEAWVAAGPAGQIEDQDALRVAESVNGPQESADSQGAAEWWAAHDISEMETPDWAAEEESLFAEDHENSAAVAQAESASIPQDTADPATQTSVMDSLVERMTLIAQPRNARRSVHATHEQETPAPASTRHTTAPNYKSPNVFDARIDEAVRETVKEDVQKALQARGRSQQAADTRPPKSASDDAKTLAGMGRHELADAIANRNLILQTSRLERQPDAVRAEKETNFERAVGESHARVQRQAEIGKTWLRAAVCAHMAGEKPNVLPDRQADSAALENLSDKDLAREVGARARAADVANASGSPDRQAANDAFKVAADLVVDRAQTQFLAWRHDRKAGRATEPVKSLMPETCEKTAAKALETAAKPAPAGPLRSRVVDAVDAHRAAGTSQQQEAFGQGR